MGVAQKPNAHAWGTVGAIALIAIAGRLTPKEMDGERLDGTDAQIAYDLVAAHLPQHDDESATVVFHSDDGLQSASGQAVVQDLLADIDADFLANLE